MILSPAILRAQMLLERDRYAEAEREVGRALSETPDHPIALSLMAMCKLHQDRKPEAEQYAARAVAADPEHPYTHYVRGWVLVDVGKLPQARAASEEALRLDPTDPDFHALRSAVYLSANRWVDALAAAEKGLEYDAEHDGCQHQRTVALTRLGRHDEADRQMSQTLRQNADDPMAHANRGWSLLHQNRPKDALEAFREALRIDPGLEYARAGVVEALKAKNPIYRLVLAFFLWMSRLSPKAQAGVILGGFVGFQVLRQIGGSVPALSVVILPIMAVYIAFVVLTWVSVPLFNLLLFTSRYGQAALSRDQKLGARIFGGYLLGVLAYFGVTLTMVLTGVGHGPTMALVCGKYSVLFALLAMPLGAVVNFIGTRRAKLYAIGFGALLAITVVALVLEAVGAPAAEPVDNLRFYSYVAAVWLLVFVGVAPKRV